MGICCSKKTEDDASPPSFVTSPAQSAEKYVPPIDQIEGEKNNKKDIDADQNIGNVDYPEPEYIERPKSFEDVAGVERLLPPNDDLIHWPITAADSGDFGTEVFLFYNNSEVCMLTNFAGLDSIKSFSLTKKTSSKHSDSSESLTISL